MLSTRGNPLLFILFSIFHYYVLQLQLIPWLWVSKNRTKTFNKRRPATIKEVHEEQQICHPAHTHSHTRVLRAVAKLPLSTSPCHIFLCSVFAFLFAAQRKTIPNQHTGERQHVKVVLRTNGLRAVSCATILRARWYRVTVLQDGLWTVFASFLGKEELPGLLMSSNLVCLWFHTAHTHRKAPASKIKWLNFFHN